jgi:2'-5' RNA ligase
MENRVEKMPRAFIAIDVSEEVRKRIVEAQEQLRATGADVKLVEPPNIHVTLKFLGEVPEKRVEEIAAALGRAVNGAKKFDIGVRGMGVFPNLSYIRVIWVGVERGRDEILELHRKIEKELQQMGFRPEADFVPHLTVARVRTAKNKERLAGFIKEKAAVDFGTSQVLAVELKQSTLTPKGPIYSTLARLELQD